jgi:probable F420-dependent oxidoreductase
MDVGVHVPQWGYDATRAGVLAVACAAEDAGLDSVWVADHVVHPHRSVSEYPYKSGGIPLDAEDGFLDAIVTLAVIAGATSRVRLGTGVFVLPMRRPLEVAKAVATLDVLSAGRVIFSVGAGWWEEEFEALGARFADRGRRMDEQMEILQALWTFGSLAHNGRDYRFAELTCRPLPVQPGGPPIWIGGMGKAGQRRAASTGDGWHAITAHPSTLRDGYATVRALAAARGRDPNDLALATSIVLPTDRDRAVERLLGLGRAGVSHVVVRLLAEGLAETVAAVEDLAANVIPTVHRELADTSTRTT